MSFQGMEFTPEMRRLIVNVKHFFSKYKKNTQFFVEKAATQLTALAMGISESNVRNVMVAFNKNGEDGLSWGNGDSRGRPSFFIEANIETAVRQFVRHSNQTGNQVTINLIKKHLEENIQYEVASTTLWRALTRWGFEFGLGTRSAQLKESARIIIRRRQYLRTKLANRKADGSLIRPEIYLDESYINKNHSKDTSWFNAGECILSKPTGKGDRLIIVNAISKDGWIPDAKLVFKATKKTGDYHASMNWNVFSNWFAKNLLPNIPTNSIIILDNASYHNILTTETFPKKSHTMKRLREWLDHNDIPWREDMLKEELFELCSKSAPKPEFALDQLAAENGHSILRTPPYHPELQPIETCWAVVKGYVAAHNNDFTMESVKKLLEEGFKKVTSYTIAGIMEKVKKQEDEFWIEDSKIEDQKEVIQEDIFDADEE